MARVFFRSIATLWDSYGVEEATVRTLEELCPFLLEQRAPKDRIPFFLLQEDGAVEFIWYFQWLSISMTVQEDRLFLQGDGDVDQWKQFHPCWMGYWPEHKDALVEELDTWEQIIRRWDG